MEEALRIIPILQFTLFTITRAFAYQILDRKFTAVLIFVRYLLYKPADGVSGNCAALNASSCCIGQQLLNPSIFTCLLQKYLTRLTSMLDINFCYMYDNVNFTVMTLVIKEAVPGQTLLLKKKSGAFVILGALVVVVVVIVVIVCE